MFSSPHILRLNAVLSAGTLALVLTACGSAPTTTLDASGMVEALAKQGMPVTPTVTYDKASDPNKLLGRPNGYTSKASFADQRVDPAKVPTAKQGDVNLGGTVEVFATAEDAEARAASVKEAAKSGPTAGEYSYVKGPVVVRVSKELMPMDAQQYEGALGKIVE
ncbi:hypothetical protein [Streptosporangium carneum]|uniref:Uncharacterized protein n=1 Tax=Streptosporangium carneum TaxID=47481 RepID=A0A9W6I3G5_9ACTN|nr:hypothetical protein [Streptosporangium carneum]GLK10983.1 hypothetical protein GCM10017600_43890 [Streptosporangium carneum]